MKRSSFLSLLQIFLAASCLLATANAPCAKPQDHINMAGLYGLLPVEVSATDYRVTNFLAHSQFAGVTLRVNWSTVEPTEGNYNWTYINSIITRANSYGKKVNIRVITGWHTPSWVYTAGAEEFWYYEDDSGQNERIPVPWDSVYQAKLGAMITALGGQYNGHSTVAHVAVSGPCRSSHEMLLPKTTADKAQWQSIGYTPELLTDAWINVLSFYEAAFPDKPWTIALHIPIYDDGVVQNVAAYASANYPFQCGVQICFWSDSNSESYSPVAALLANADEFTHGGLEALGVFPDRGGDINVAMQKAINWHTTTWVEVYHNNRDQVTTLYNEITKHKQMVSSAAFDAADGQTGQSQLTWTKPSGYSGFQSVKILRKQGDFPNGADDASATVVYQGTGTSYLDTGLTAGVEYHYAMYELPSKYTIGQDTAAPPVVYISTASEDGYITESTETSNVGGTCDSIATGTAALRIGDTATDQQYKSVVSFDTSGIPDTATILSATLRIHRGTIAGTNPFTTHGACYADIKNGAFSGNAALQAGDFEASANALAVATMSNAATNWTWSEGTINATGLSFISKTGRTQFRLRFATDDNDDLGQDYLGFCAGEYTDAALRPQLVVTYLP